jgi:hypothetical protein
MTALVTDDGVTRQDLNACEASDAAFDQMCRSGEFLYMACCFVKRTHSWGYLSSFTQPHGHKRFIYGADMACYDCANSKTKLAGARIAAPTMARDAAEQATWGQIC